MEWNFLLTMQTIELAAFVRPGKAYSAPSDDDVQNSLISAFQASVLVSLLASRGGTLAPEPDTLDC